MKNKIINDFLSFIDIFCTKPFINFKKEYLISTKMTKILTLIFYTIFIYLAYTIL